MLPIMETSQVLLPVTTPLPNQLKYQRKTILGKVLLLLVNKDPTLPLHHRVGVKEIIPEIHHNNHPLQVLLMLVVIMVLHRRQTILEVVIIQGLAMLLHSLIRVPNLSLLLMFRHLLRRAMRHLLLIILLQLRI